jgi:hypothetical protein
MNLIAVLILPLQTITGLVVHLVVRHHHNSNNMNDDGEISLPQGVATTIMTAGRIKFHSHFEDSIPRQEIMMDESVVQPRRLPMDSSSFVDYIVVVVIENTLLHNRRMIIHSH